MLNKTHIQGVSSSPSALGAPGLHANPIRELSFAPRPKSSWGGGGMPTRSRDPQKPTGAPIPDGSALWGWKPPSQARFHNRPTPWLWAPFPAPLALSTPVCLSFPPCSCLIWAACAFSRQDPSPPHVQRQELAQKGLRSESQPQGATLKLFLQTTITEKQEKKNKQTKKTPTILCL